MLRNQELEQKAVQFSPEEIKEFDAREAQLYALQAEISSLAGEALRPYSAASNVALVFLFVWPFVHLENIYFRTMRDKYFENHPNHLEEIQAVNEVERTYYGARETSRRVVGQFFPADEPDLETLLVRFENLDPPTNPLVYQESLSNLKKLFAVCADMAQKNIDYFFKLVNLGPYFANNGLGYPIKVILSKTANLIQNNQKLRQNRQDAANTYARECTDRDITEINNVAKIGSSLLLQFTGLAHRLVRWQFPHGLYESRQPFRFRPEDLEDKELESKLVALRDRVKNRAAQTQSVMPYFTACSLGVLSALYFGQLEDLDPRIVALAFGLGISGLKDTYLAITSYSQKKSLKDNFSTSKTRLNDLLHLENYEPTVTISESQESLAASQFTVRFPGNGALKAEKMASIFVQSLNFHHVPTVSYHHNRVTLAANFVDHPSWFKRGYHFCRRVIRFGAENDPAIKLKKVRDLFVMSVDRHKQIIELKRNVYKLLSKILGTRDVEILSLPQLDNNGLPFITIEFSIKKNWIKPFADQIAKLFTPNSTQVKVTDEGIHVVVTGHQNIQDQWESILKDLTAAKLADEEQSRKNAAVQQVQTKPQQIVQAREGTEEKNETKEKHTKKKTQKHKPKQEPPKEKLSLEEERKRAREIESKELAKRFHLSEKEREAAPVFRIDSSQVRDYQSYQNTTHFIRNCLDENKVGTACYQKVQDYISHATMVVGRGKQGVKLWKGFSERDQDNGDFTTAIKISFYGEKDNIGDMRVYARLRETPGCNGALYEIVGVDAHAHRPSRKKAR